MISMSPGNNWRNGWTTGHDPDIGFTFVPSSVDTWAPEPWPALESVDLALDKASGGALGARRTRAVPGGAGVDTGWHCYDADFEFIYVLKGAISIENEAGEHYTLGPGAAGTHPARFWHRRYGATPDLEYVHITVPGRPRIISDHGSVPPSPDLESHRKPHYTFDSPQAYTLGAGPRSYFKYRDLETAGPTGGRIHIHVVRATEPGTATGWHYHSMSQWFMIVGGSSTLYVEELTQPMTVLDSMCIGRGMRHDVAPYSGDYAVLEMCVPAEYETMSVSAPEKGDTSPRATNAMGLEH